ncbi:hypothetical protein H7H78_08760 [Mycobacterium shinjukuense]|uniref:Type B diterpene cyclase n=2 Tax=Mycobacterium TaxID=1763 RepID=A0A7I7MKM4_9MYCO|nr:prenyltransferase/squalene oxidase repeat-containing protein [Mycobacterium shinjukuense]MCV6985519.1 hypothetical protein [Mycobacterium shinjukuense]ORB66574.1 hypothetical protein BST45_13530 [Mycobacterium shinjukuense]BBX72706.1 type B diterpene cyclase [Mycobacterium shinjukuense]
MGKAAGQAFSLMGAVERLIGKLGDGRVASSAYSTAWAARWAMDTGPLFPEARDWLRCHQHDDGSWGGIVESPHDRLVSTLAAVLATKDIDESWAKIATQAGCDYLLRHTDAWRHSYGQTLGFDVVAPCLLGHAQAAGLLPARCLDGLQELRAERLLCFAGTSLLERPTSHLYHLEVLEPYVSAGEAAKFMSARGGFFTSTAGTGAVWAATGNDAALRFLQRAHEFSGDGGMPELIIDIFEPAWALYLLSRAGIKPRVATAAGDRLFRLARTVAPARGGLTWTEHVELADSDCTSMVANALHAYGYDVASLTKQLLSFETDQHFLGFMQGERRAAVTANGRVLEAFAREPNRYAHQIAKIVAFLEDTRHEGAWWIDKWHLSPYYATFTVVCGLVGVTPGRLGETWKWLLNTQHADGSWGMAGGLAEETAYAVLALNALEPFFGEPPADSYRRAFDYLRQHAESRNFPELWIGRSLYTPSLVVEAAVLAAISISGAAAKDDLESSRWISRQ